MMASNTGRRRFPDDHDLGRGWRGCSDCGGPFHPVVGAQCAGQGRRLRIVLADINA